MSSLSGVGADSPSDETLLYASPGGGVSAAAGAAALSPSITDPSTADGSTLVFAREIPLEVRHSDDHDSALGTLLTVTVKLLVLLNERGTPDSVRIELSRENDLFFSMYHTLQEKGATRDAQETCVQRATRSATDCAAPRCRSAGRSSCFPAQAAAGA